MASGRDGAATRERPYRGPGPIVRRINHFVPWLAWLGLTGNTVGLEVRGRRSGRPRRTAITVARVNGERYAVSLAGEAEWVRNVRAAGGDAVLYHRGRHRVRLEEVPAEERAPVLHAWLGGRALTRSRAMSARVYFGLPPNPTLEQLQPLASKYPVFRIVPR